MKKQPEKSEFDKTREGLVETIESVGFDIFTLREFFTFLWDQCNTTEALIEGIPGGVDMKCTGIPYEDKHISGRERHPWDLCQARYNLRHHGSNVSCLLIPPERQLEAPLEGDLCFILKPAIDAAILTDKNFSRARRKLFKLFVAAFFFPEIYGEEKAVAQLRTVLKYWEETLDAYRVVLRLAGKHDYPKDIQQADIFLRLLRRESQAKNREQIRSRRLSK